MAVNNKTGMSYREPPALFSAPSWAKVATWFLLVSILHGCATYGNNTASARAATASGNYPLAKRKFSQLLPADGRNALLHNMEIGSISHLQGQYHQSNQLFETAERIIEKGLDTTAKTSKILLGANIAPYEAPDFEKVLVNYYKLINFISMSQQSSDVTNKANLLDKARVEARRIDLKLNELAVIHGDYKQAEKDRNSTLQGISNFIGAVSGFNVDKHGLIYRDDPWSHYLAGYTYEPEGELDDARIEYQKAAVLYESGAVKQYQLEGNITEQAWFDTIRMMKKSGGYYNQWTKLSKIKLSTTLRDQLADDSNVGQLLVIDQIGMVPTKKELDFLLTANSYLHSFVLRPIFTGTIQERQDQRAWFSMLYANQSLAQLSIDYSNGKTSGRRYSTAQKIVFLGPAWSLAESIGVPQSLQYGARISVPYYAPLRSKPGPSTLFVGDKSYRLSDGSSIAQLAIQEQLARTSKELYQGLAREIVKTMATDKLTGYAGLGSLASLLTGSSDTRSWLTLPHQIRMTRITLPAGTHVATLTSKMAKNGSTQTRSKTFTIKPGQHVLWVNNSLGAGAQAIHK